MYRNPIRWTIAAQPTAGPLKPGDTFAVDVSATIDQGWHLYSTTPIENGPIPTRFTIASGRGFEAAGEVKAPDPLGAKDPNFGVEIDYHEGSVTITVPVKVTPQAASGKTALALPVRYRTCNDKLCLPPEVMKLEIPVEIAAAK